jgi:hypothetical protein
MLLVNVSDEPSEHEMRGAFEDVLTDQVRNALEFIAETGGAGAVDRVRQSGADRFTVRRFHKGDCRRSPDRAGHLCAFTVEIGVVSGQIQRTLAGRFNNGRLVVADQV